ncbi:MAG: FtsQ-type POTRA domain-containing protein [Treponema sp.]|nr:FtsQ-type POTRA domain-containing protein [Treponema sp.]
MSDCSIIEEIGEFDQFELRREPVEQNSGFVKWIKILIAVLLVVLGAELIIYKVVHPSLNAPKLYFSGLERLTAQELTDELSEMYGQNWYNFDTDEACAKLCSVSSVESVTMEKQFPDKIKITVTERVPVAMMFLSVNGRTEPIQIDKNGVLFTLDDKFISNDGSIPIISGIPVENLVTGMRIPAKYRVLIEQIYAISLLPQKYFLGISEICVVPKAAGNYELILIPVNSKLRVLTDRSLKEESLQYMMVAQDVVNEIEPNASVIDLRYGSVSYRTGVSGGTL